MTHAAACFICFSVLYIRSEIGSDLQFTENIIEHHCLCPVTTEVTATMECDLNIINAFNQ